MARKGARCEYVIRRAGHAYDGTPVAMGGYGDTTEMCGKFGGTVPHTFHVKRRGVYDTIEGTTVRCPEHEEASR